MSKILLIEDRSARQKLFMEDTKIDLNKYSDILDNMIDDKYNTLYDALKTESFIFENYEVIISHKSAYDNDNSAILHRLENYCKTNNKKLVLFSGGVDFVYHYKDADYEHLELNSKLFYSYNLELFFNDFKNGNFNILSLAYGKQWKLNIMLEVLEKINFYIEINNKSSFFYKRFALDVNIESLKNINVPIEFEYNEKKISKDEIIKLKDKLLAYIQKGIKYE